VGLGGRLDATNAAEPVLSLITEIGLDHREHLGETLAEIAAEKAGILRRDRPAVAWVGDREARGAIEDAAADLGARLRFASDLCRIEQPLGAAGQGRSTVELATAAGVYRARLSLLGRHQLPNVALAVAAAEELAALGWSRIDGATVEAGLGACRWPGRLEWVGAGPGGERFLLDGAHNPAAIEALVGYLSEHLPRYVLIFGALREKEVAGMLPALAAAAERVILTAPNSPRAIEPAELAALVTSRRPEVVSDAAGALAAALGSAQPIVVTGSLYLVGEMRSELRRRFGKPRPAAEIATYEALR